ncbi:MAG TPA: hypothetical protein VLX92_19615 [Kofleriaceae bacterium]|nr:hypothetical protein [Kofleriaceae bacterium]
MPTAIVTITCPNCGGKVDGITATDVAQTIACPYCKTELHVPHVGEVIRETEVVHEKVVYVEQPSDPGADIDVLTANRNKQVRVAASIAVLVLGLVMLLAINASNKSDAERMDRDFKAEQSARDQCEADCKAKCEAAPPADQPRTGDPALDQDLDKTVNEANVTLCESQCEIDKDCYGLHH